MRTRLICGLMVLTTAAQMAVPGGPPVVAAPSVGECRSQSAGERPVLTADDIVNCVISSTSPTRVRLSVAFTYASAMGNQNIWMGIDMLAGGNRLKWFGFRPVPITTSSGTATFEIHHGQNNPPMGTLVTDQIEFFLT
jgi:hypothetical protein